MRMRRCHSAPGHHLAVRGFELARKHHMQEGHKINVRVAESARSLLDRWTRKLGGFHLLYAETRSDAHGGGARIINGANVEISYAHSVEAAHAVFDPNVTDATGAPVRSYPYRVKIPRGYMRFPTGAWHEGQYCMGTVKKYDAKTGRYTVAYASGPYKQTEGPRLALGPPHKGLPDGTVIENCHRAFLSADETIKPDSFPWFMLLISAVQIGAFAYWAPKMDEPIGATTPTAGPTALWFKTVRNFPHCNDRRAFWTMALSYQLVHAGLEHLGFNIFLQLLFGIPIELVHGAVVFVIYEVGVVAGALACAVSDPYIAVVGCSGGVYCLFGIHVAHMLLNWKDMKHSAVPAWARLLLFLALFGSEVTTWWLLNTAGKSFAAHAGGAFAGFFMGVGFLTNFEVECWETVARNVARFILLAFFAISIAWYVLEDPPAPLFTTWNYGDKNKIPCCFQLFECDIERKYKYYNHFECSKDLYDHKNSYQYNLQVGDSNFQTCPAIRSELDATFGCGDCGPYN